MAGEFDLIARYFDWPVPDGVLGVGDDCALLPVRAGYRLAVTTDLLIEGVHFLSDVDPQALGHKALAVNVSDLAAMGARPLGCLLGISLPCVDVQWLKGFSSGFRQLATRTGCPLVGGDTTSSRGGIAISVTAMGEVPLEGALTRAGARAGDDIWITGTLGGAHVALQLLQASRSDGVGGHVVSIDTGRGRERLERLRGSLERPEPPVAFGADLAGIAHAAIDISDGLLQDLGHILRASGCSAELHYGALPVHPALADLPDDEIQAALLTGGDVYQLCFTAPRESAATLEQLAARHQVQLSRIGQVQAGNGVRVVGSPYPVDAHAPAGFDHFRGNDVG